MIAFFEKIIDVLNDLNIPYMLSGSVAMSLYTVPRATQDMDFVVHLKPENVDEFVGSFYEGYYCDRDAVYEAVNTKGMFNIIDHASGFKADFVILKNERFRQVEFNRRVPVDFYGKTVYAVTVEDLLISKLIWIQDYQWSQQVEDIKSLAETEDMNWIYVKEWINKLELNTFALIPV